MTRFLTEPFESLWRHRVVTLKFFMIDIRHNYAGSFLGLLWMVGLPLIFLLSYSFIYAVIFKVKPEGMEIKDYVVHVCSGIMAFLSFATALSSGSCSLVQKKEMLTCTHFPIHLIPLRAVLSSFNTIVIGFLMLSIYVFFDKGYLMPLIYGPCVIISFLLATIGVVWILSVVSVVLKDIQQFLIFINMFLLIVSPISYTESMVPSTLKAIIYCNPLTYFIMPLQYIFTKNTSPPLSIMIAMQIISLLTFTIGYFIFNKTRSVVIDHV